MGLESCASSGAGNCLEHKREELFELRQKKLDGMIVRSHTKWLFEVEKNTKYFCNLEKINFVQKAMCFIEKENGEVIHDSDTIIKETRRFMRIYMLQEILKL